MYQQSAYALMSWALGMLQQPGIWFVLGPLLTLRFILRFLRWAFATSRGERDAEGMAEQATETLYGLDNRLTYGRSYRQMRGEVASERDLRQRRYRF